MTVPQDQFPAITPPVDTYTAKAVTSASAFSAAGITVVLIWVASLFHFEVPQSVGLILGGMIATLIGMVAHRLPPPLTSEQHRALYEAFLARLSRGGIITKPTVRPSIDPIGNR